MWQSLISDLICCLWELNWSCRENLCSISSLWACLKPATKIQECKRKPSKDLSQNMENMAASALGLEAWNFFHYPFWVHFYPCLVPLSVPTYFTGSYHLCQVDLTPVNIWLFPQDWEGVLFIQLRSCFMCPYHPWSQLSSTSVSQSASENWKWPPVNFKESQSTYRCSIAIKVGESCCTDCSKYQTIG